MVVTAPSRARSRRCCRPQPRCLLGWGRLSGTSSVTTQRSTGDTALCHFLLTDQAGLLRPQGPVLQPRGRGGECWAVGCPRPHGTEHLLSTSYLLASVASQRTEAQGLSLT